MTDCATIEPILAPLADGDVEPEDRRRAEAHLAECAACRRALEECRVAREVLQRHAGELHEPAPPTLRDRVRPAPAAVVPMALPAAGTRPAWWRAVPLPAAAAFVIALTGVVAVGALAPRATVFAAQLALDHMKCLFLTSHEARPDPATLAATWRRDRHWDITVPPSSPDQKIELVALRRCLSGDGVMAHLLYASAGQPVSLFVIPAHTQPAPELAIMGQRTLAWTSAGRTYAVVGNIPDEELAKVRSYLQPRVR